MLEKATGSEADPKFLLSNCHQTQPREGGSEKLSEKVQRRIHMRSERESRGGPKGGQEAGKVVTSGPMNTTMM
jgi:hypothetical protein